MKSIHKLVTVYGVLITLCYAIAALKFGTNGALFTAATNALLAILMLTVIGGDKQKLKKLVSLIIGEKNGESDDTEDSEG